MRALAALGRCAPGLNAAVVSDQSLYGDNPKYDTAPIVSASSPAYTGKLAGLPLKTVLVRANSAATLEQIVYAAVALTLIVAGCSLAVAVGGGLVAAGIAYGTSMWAFVRLAPKGTAIPQLGHDYYTIMGIGLVVAFGVITVTLPLLRRMTAPGNVRFE